MLSKRRLGAAVPAPASRKLCPLSCAIIFGARAALGSLARGVRMHVRLSRCVYSRAHLLSIARHWQELFKSPCAGVRLAAAPAASFCHVRYPPLVSKLTR